jgi:hypothetical protein
VPTSRPEGEENDDFERGRWGTGTQRRRARRRRCGPSRIPGHPRGARRPRDRRRPRARPRSEHRRDDDGDRTHQRTCSHARESSRPRLDHVRRVGVLQLLARGRVGPGGRADWVRSNGPSSVRPGANSSRIARKAEDRGPGQSGRRLPIWASRRPSNASRPDQFPAAVGLVPWASGALGARSDHGRSARGRECRGARSLSVTKDLPRTTTPAVAS